MIQFISRFSSVRVLCVGDVMLDHFVYGEVNRISPEAPIPIVRVTKERSMLGGAGNVIRNLSSLGAGSLLVAVAGADRPADQIKAELAALPNSNHELVSDKNRQTTVKTRYLSGSQQLLRVDVETAHGVDEQTLAELLHRFESLLPQCDVVVLSDYAKGVLTGERAAAFISAGRSANKPVFVDPKGRDFNRYRGASLIKPNLHELADATYLPVSTDAEVEAAARSVLLDSGIAAVLVTRGAAGMMLVRKGEPSVLLGSAAREIFDVSGAGDTVAAAFAACVAAGMKMEDAMHAANLAAGLVVGKMGTATVSQDELLKALNG